MSSAPSVPGVEVGAPWLGDCKHALTAGALEMLAALAGTFRPRHAELFVADLEDKPMPVARIARVLGTSVKACGPDATSLMRWTGSAAPVWHSTAQHPEGRSGPLTPMTKEYVHARLPAGL